MISGAIPEDEDWHHWRYHGVDVSPLANRRLGAAASSRKAVRHWLQSSDNVHDQSRTPKSRQKWCRRHRSRPAGEAGFPSAGGLFV